MKSLQAGTAAVDITPPLGRHLCGAFTDRIADNMRVGDLGLAAHRLNPSLRPLTIETCRALLKAKRPKECLDVIAGLSAAGRANGRIRYLEGPAALDCGDFGRVEHLFPNGIEVIDLREGEKSLDEFWFTFHERRLSAQEGVPPDDALRARVRKEFLLPKQYDFRMSEQ